ncbi:hypothetical protein FOA52_012799 [Chlamydomonas sp. UWO 241]|nr:hypothetical protein FOA52_012799 [Chlamydomonas sp. UWO 241]
MPAQRDVKAHDKEVLSLMLACVGEDPESLKRSLFSAGVDNRVVGWDCDSLKETAKFKLDAKV